jgi:hypothetical protein
MIYLISILITLCFCFYTKYQLKDLWSNRKFEWKRWGMLMRALIIFGLFEMQYFKVNWQNGLLCGVLNIIIFEIGINLIALNKSVFYVGTTGQIDKHLGSKKWIIYIILLLSSIAILILT